MSIVEKLGLMIFIFGTVNLAYSLGFDASGSNGAVLEMLVGAVFFLIGKKVE